MRITHSRLFPEPDGCHRSALAKNWKTAHSPSLLDHASSGPPPNFTVALASCAPPPCQANGLGAAAPPEYESACPSMRTLTVWMPSEGSGFNMYVRCGSCAPPA